MSRSLDTEALVVALVGGSHLVNHAYLILLPPAFPLLAVSFDVSTVQLGLAVGLLGAVVTALQLPFGYLSDGYSRTAVLAVSLTLGPIGAGMAAVAPSFEWLLAAQIVMGIGVAGHHPAHYPMLSAAAIEGRRGRAYSVHGFTGALGLATPFAVVPGVLFLGGGWREAFALLAAAGFLYGVVCLSAFWVRVPRDVTHPRDPVEGLPALGRVGRRARSELRGFLAAPVILLLTALWFVNSMAVWGVRTYAPTLLSTAYGIAPATASLYGSAMLAVGAAFILGGGYLTDRIAGIPVLLAGYGGLVLLAAALAAGLPSVAAIGAVLVLSATIDVSRPARSTLTDHASARDDVGKNFALMTIGISAGGAVAPPLFGFVIDSGGTTLPVLGAVSGVALAFYGVAATALVAILLTLAVRARVREPEPGTAPADD